MEALLDRPGLLSRVTYVEVDLEAIEANFLTIKQEVGPKTQVMAVLKSDAYGHGLLAVARRLIAKELDYIGVVCLEEALELRDAGISTPVLLMAGVEEAGFADAIKHQLTIGVIDNQHIEALESLASDIKQPVKVHLKVDTGMHRLGLLPHEVKNAVLKLASCKHIELEGIYSHLANSDDISDNFAMEQLKRFKAVCAEVESLLGRSLIKHIANSDAVFRDKALHLDLVRPGMALYGYSKRNYTTLKSTMRLVSKIVQIKEVRAGDTVGYDRHFHATKAGRIAVVPIGYADGYSRAYAGVYAIVEGKPAPVIGRVCMYMLMLDVTAHPEVGVGDEVTLLGQSGGAEINVYDLAKASHTTHYEVLSSIPSRLPRFYLEENLSKKKDADRLHTLHR